MIFVSCERCRYRMDIFQELVELVEAPLSCPRCGGLELTVEATFEPEDEAA